MKGSSQGSELPSMMSHPLMLSNRIGINIMYVVCSWSNWELRSMMCLQNYGLNSTREFKTTMES